MWRIRANQTKLVCAVGSRNGTEETKLIVLDFEAAKHGDRVGFVSPQEERMLTRMRSAGEFAGEVDLFDADEDEEGEEEDEGDRLAAEALGLAGETGGLGQEQQEVLLVVGQDLEGNLFDKVGAS